ncbi:Ribosomal RNA small subunit methyltransferase J [Hirschfeldia incana]|nr:Ribosomal RNA small subunit methyltransferase J [Hirschfeldia incana]
MASLLLPSSQLLLHSRTQHNVQPLLLPRSSPKTPFFFVSSPSLRRQHSTSASASKNSSEAFTAVKTTENKKQPEKKHLSEEEEAEEEVEEDMLWIQEKALELAKFTGSVAQALPGPRVGSTKLPWMLAVPLTYAGATLVTSVVKTVNNLSSPNAQRKKLANQNAMLCKSIDEMLQREGTVSSFELKALEEKTEFNMEEILRKYIHYALNEKPFNPDLVANLIHLRRASGLNESQMPEVLNEISRSIVKDKGPVVMNKQGFTEKGFKRKLAVQTFFGKIYYLTELPDFCLKDNSLVVKEIFGVTDEDAEKLRIHALAEAGDLDSLEKMVEFEKAADSSSSSDREDSNEEDDSTTSP